MGMAGDLAPRASLRYLALGDSYTIGEGVASEHSWPAQLAHALREHGIDIADPQVIAATGWTTDELDAAIDAARPGHHHDLVSLLVGVNNQYRQRPLDEYAAQFEGLLLRAIAFASAGADRVLVLSIPDWGVTPFAQADARGTAAIGAAIDGFNAVAREICERHGVAFVDITPASRRHGAEPTMLVEDGLHPSAAMYALWCELALPVARRLLADR